MTDEDYTTLSLDLGSSFGWALAHNGKIVESGIVNLYSKDTHPGTRFTRFHNWLATKGKGVKHIVYEKISRFESADSAKVHCGLLALTQMYCLNAGKRMTALHVNTVKKEFTGNGHAKKEEICRTAHRLGWKGGHLDTDVDHDEADAIAIMWVHLTRNELNPILEPAS